MEGRAGERWHSTTVTGPFAYTGLQWPSGMKRVQGTDLPLREGRCSACVRQTVCLVRNSL
jgi:hypothetical protein